MARSLHAACENTNVEAGREGREGRGGPPDAKVLFLSDILPTGDMAVVNARVGPGSTLAIFGAGPVGCMAAACARYLGVERIFMIDHHERDRA